MVFHSDRDPDLILINLHLVGLNVEQAAIAVEHRDIKVTGIGTMKVTDMDLQSDIFDHVLAVLPEFDLRIDQAPSGDDFRTVLTQDKG